MSDVLVPIPAAAAPDKATTPHPKEKNLRDYLAIIQKRWILILFTVILSGLTSFFYTAYQVPMYLATAKIAILTPQIRTMGTMQMGQENFRAFPLKAHQEILMSRPIAQKVVEQIPESVSLSFFGIPKEKLTEGHILGAISVEARRDSDLLYISCEGRTPADAAFIANLLVDVFIQANKQQQMTTQGGLLNWIKEEIPKIEAKIAKNREMVFKFEEENPDLFFVSQDQNSFGTNILDMIKRELQDAQINVIKSSILYEKCQQARKSGKVENILALEFFDQNPFIDKLKQQKFDLESQLDELKLRYKDTHPKTIWLKENIARLDKKIFEEAELLMRRNEIKYLDLKEKEAQLEKMFQEQQAKSLGSKKKYLEYDRYRREYDSLQKMYTTFIDKMKELDTLAGYRLENVRLVDSAVAPSRPYKPNKMRNYLLACMLGFMLSLGLIFLLENLDEPLTAAELQKTFEAPIHGFVPFISPKQFSGQPSFAVQEKEHSSVADVFRSIGTAIFFAEKNEPSHSFVLSSPTMGEGKSTLLCNLSFIIAKAGYKVLLVDGDLRKPKLHKYLNLKLDKNAPGFTQLLEKKATLADVVVSVSPNLYCIPAGKIPQNSYECIHNSDLEQLRQQMQAEFQYIFIDSPPLGMTSDALLFSNAFQKLLLVISARNNQKTLLEQLAQKMHQMQLSIHGLILNDREGNLPDAYGYYRGYYKSYQSYYEGDHAKADSKEG